MFCVQFCHGEPLRFFFSVLNCMYRYGTKKDEAQYLVFTLQFCPYNNAVR